MDAAFERKSQESMIPWLVGVFGFSEEFFDINNLHGIQIQGLQKVLKISISGRLFFYYGISRLSKIVLNSAISSGKKKSSLDTY